MDRAVMEMIYCDLNPMTNEDLKALVERKPAVYGRYVGLVGKLSD